MLRWKLEDERVGGWLKEKGRRLLLYYKWYRRNFSRTGVILTVAWQTTEKLDDGASRYLFQILHLFAHLFDFIFKINGQMGDFGIGDF